MNAPQTQARYVHAIIPPAQRRSWPMRVFFSGRVWLVLLFSLIVWELATRLFDIPTYLLPAPRLVVGQFAERPGLFLEGLRVTAIESAVGFTVAAVTGGLLGILIARSRLTEEMLYPYLNILRVTPVVAIAPLLTIWLGHGMTPIIVVSALIAFFPIVVGTVLGMKSVDAELISLMRILNASEFTELRRIRLPNALPHLFAAFRISAPMAVIGAIVGEFVGGSRGLGYLLVAFQAQLSTSSVFVLVLLSGLLGIAFFNVVVLLERRFVPWLGSVQS
jgi:NitT/TauT family transport system permease protein